MGSIWPEIDLPACLFDIVELEPVRDEPAEIHAPGIDHAHQPAHALFAVRARTARFTSFRSSLAHSTTLAIAAQTSH